MLTRAQDYLYYSPIATGIHGTPLPVRTGAAKTVVEYEDVVYLAEMAAERWIWCTADTYPYHDRGEDVFTTPLTNPDSLVLKRADLQRIQNVARRIATHFYPGDQIGTFADNGHAVPASWNDGLSTNSPIVGDTALAAWLATAALPAYTEAVAEAVESTTPYETLFSYFDGIKRYVFYHLDAHVSGLFLKDSEIVDVSGREVVLTQVGDATIVDTDGASQQSTSYQVSQALAPWYMRDYHRKTGSTTDFQTDTETCAAESGYKFYIHKTFATNRLTGAFPMLNPVLYLRLVGRVQVRYYGGSGTNYDSGLSIPIVVKCGSVSSPTVAGTVDYPVHYALSKNDIMGPMTQYAYNALVNWAGQNVTDFDMQGSNRVIVTVQFDGAYLDTGVVQHCSNLQ